MNKLFCVSYSRLAATMNFVYVFVLFLESKYDNVQALCLKEKDAKTCKVAGSDKKKNVPWRSRRQKKKRK